MKLIRMKYRTEIRKANPDEFILITNSKDSYYSNGDVFQVGSSNGMYVETKNEHWRVMTFEYEVIKEWSGGV